MNRIFVGSSLSPLSIRGYVAVAAERSRGVEATSTRLTRVAADAILSSTADEKEQTNFWMRDPTTGNWMPENKISRVEVDPAMLRAKFLSSKK